MIKLTIDGQQVEVEQGRTVLDAAKLAGKEIPTLCHHPAVPPAGAVPSACYSHGV
jgi:NADH dehydrogenase/NADH:ubiquinone oxidoreductase subunit G